MKRLLLLMCLSSVCWAEPKTEIGELNGAKYRIDVPEGWNGGLVMYCHGYSPAPADFSGPLPKEARDFLEVFLGQGYAVAQSGYASTGWAIQDAVQDTEALRRYFSSRYGPPKETYVTGHSMGGFLTMMLVESHPNSYDGGLALCGPLGAANWFMLRRAFDPRVVFDYYFPGALPSPVRVPAEYTMSRALTEEIAKLLVSKADEAAAVRRYTGIRTNEELAGTMVFFTYILKDLQQRAGGNPFDNRNTIYEGTPDDNSLNDKVARYAADPGAAEYLRRYYTPTGRLTRPLLAIHTTYDTLVPPWITNAYSVISEMGGGASFFVQQYVKHDGHCTIAPGEVALGFSALRDWRVEGKRPAAGLTH